MLIFFVFWLAKHLLGCVCVWERERGRDSCMVFNLTGRLSLVNQRVFTPLHWRHVLLMLDAAVWMESDTIRKATPKGFDTNVDMNTLSITIFLLEGLSHSLLSSVYPWGSSSEDSTSSSSDDSASSFIPSSSLSSSSSANRNNFP